MIQRAAHIVARTRNDFALWHPRYANPYGSFYTVGGIERPAIFKPYDFSEEAVERLLVEWEPLLQRDSTLGVSTWPCDPDGNTRIFPTVFLLDFDAAVTLGRLYDQITIGGPEGTYPANGPGASTFIPNEQIPLEEKLRWIKAVC